MSAADRISENRAAAGRRAAQDRTPAGRRAEGEAPKAAARPPRGRPPPFARWRAGADELIGEIAVTAERIAEARDGHGRQIARVERFWRILRAVERSPYCLAIADLARALAIRRQSAHELGHAAERAGYLELRPNPDDRRLLQAFLTPSGRAALNRGRSAERLWQDTLLNGLAERDMAVATRVLRVMRQRLERDVRERAQRQGQRRPWPGGAR